jgi:hypothetical protein
MVAVVKRAFRNGGSFYTHIWGLEGVLPPYLGDRPGT